MSVRPSVRYQMELPSSFGRTGYPGPPGREGRLLTALCKPGQLSYLTMRHTLRKACVHVSRAVPRTIQHLRYKQLTTRTA